MHTMHCIDYDFNVSRLKEEVVWSSRSLSGAQLTTNRSEFQFNSVPLCRDCLDFDSKVIISEF